MEAAGLTAFGQARDSMVKYFTCQLNAQAALVALLQLTVRSSISIGEMRSSKRRLTYLQAGRTYLSL